MALRRKGKDVPDDDNVDLGGPEHAWWASDPKAAPAPGPEPAPSVPLDDPAAADPYAVLKVPASASWEQITSAYHRLARMWHPDGLQNPAPGEKELCEDMIRRLNIAYTELRVRRGK